jgi:hypothetical protein
MPSHEIEMQLPAQTILNADATITIWSDGAVLGRLQVSKGSIDWIPGRAVKAHKRLSWERFDELMKAYGRDVG